MILLSSQECTTWSERIMAHYYIPKVRGQWWVHYGLWAKLGHAI